ncbi:hypothetical protein [Bosea sp. BK604]|uniref:hypothetical protein n=1 Tax=Bosea sp. BK604 TaxID=2512180 RepID=UPI0020C16659|nr:hypothetical protein [Bosea sp. BK604]
MTVSACSTPDKPIVRTEFIRPAIPAEARQHCADPVSLPDRALKAQEVTSLWSRDRAGLRICEQRRAAAVSASEGAAP